RAWRADFSSTPNPASVSTRTHVHTGWSRGRTYSPSTVISRDLALVWLTSRRLLTTGRVSPSVSSAIVCAALWYGALRLCRGIRVGHARGNGAGPGGRPEPQPADHDVGGDGRLMHAHDRSYKHVPVSSRLTRLWRNRGGRSRGPGRAG